MSIERTCIGCGTVLKRQRAQSSDAFRRRQYCSMACKRDHIARERAKPCQGGCGRTVKNIRLGLCVACADRARNKLGWRQSAQPRRKDYADQRPDPALAWGDDGRTLPCMTNPVAWELPEKGQPNRSNLDAAALCGTCPRLADCAVRAYAERPRSVVQAGMRWDRCGHPHPVRQRVGA